MNYPTSALISLWLRRPSHEALMEIHKFRDCANTLDTAIHYEKCRARPRRVRGFCGRGTWSWPPARGLSMGANCGKAVAQRKTA